MIGLHVSELQAFKSTLPLNSAAVGRGADKVGWDALSKNISIITNTINITIIIMDPQQVPHVHVKRTIR